MGQAKWTEMLNDAFNHFENYHTQKLYFLKESLDACEYIAHPYLIASKWLTATQYQAENNIVID